MMDIYQSITITSIYAVYKRLINIWTKKTGSRQMIKNIYLPNTDRKKWGGVKLYTWRGKKSY